MKYKLFLWGILFSIPHLLFAQSRVKFYLEPQLGLDALPSSLNKNYKHKDYQILRAMNTSLGYNASLGLNVHLLESWQFTFRLADVANGAGIKTQIHSNGISAGSKSTWGSQIHQFTGTVEHTFFNWRIENGLLRNWGMDFQGGLGLGYDYIYKVNRSDTPFLIPSLTIGWEIKHKAYENQKKWGEGVVLFGINTQITYKGRKFLKIGIWYNYVPNPMVEYDYYLTNMVNGYQENFILDGTKHRFSFFASFPIKLFQLN